MASFPQASLPTPCTHLYPPPYAPHAEFVDMQIIIYIFIKTQQIIIIIIIIESFYSLWSTGHP
jgi:hypothetical protein